MDETNNNLFPLKIQPNPFTSSTTFILPETISLSECELVISDFVGKTISIIKPDNYYYEFKRESIASGIYNVQLIVNKSAVNTVKMMVH